MYALRAYINHPFLETFYGELKNLSKKLITFSFFHKKFPKMGAYSSKPFINLRKFIFNKDFIFCAYIKIKKIKNIFHT